MNIQTIPHNLWNAIREMKREEVIKEVLGDHTFEKYINAKTKEWDEYSIQVTQWEIDNYLGKY